MAPDLTEVVGMQTTISTLAYNFQGFIIRQSFV